MKTTVKPILQENGHAWQYTRETDVFFCLKCESTTFDPVAEGSCKNG